MQGNSIGPDFGKTAESVLKMNSTLWSMRLQSTILSHARFPLFGINDTSFLLDNQIGWGISSICDALIQNKSLLMYFAYALGLVLLTLVCACSLDVEGNSLGDTGVESVAKV